MTLTDWHVAVMFQAAEARGDAQTAAEMENEAFARMGMSLDETEQGATAAADEALAQWIKAALG